MQHVPERRGDWVWIIDHTLQWGTARCLVVLGVSASHLATHGYRLSHADVCVLALEVVEHSDGTVVHQQLAALALRVGVPRQIVSDRGSDLAKGIRLFQQEHPEVIDTYDITHKMACLLKGLLANDASWQAFCRQCGAVGGTAAANGRQFPAAADVADQGPLHEPGDVAGLGRTHARTGDAGRSRRLAVALQKSVAETQSWWQETFGWLEGFRAELSTWSQLWALVCRAEEQVRAGASGWNPGSSFARRCQRRLARMRGCIV